ncbi:adenylate/guanylate cyclase domain-containing protein [Acidiferrimicrobium sp. IK]|uniref:adenylate/guanylate cyclase domain-containing protein n=1 Tax=Acidiferrimicrobium sp. IK TaxID=2871700 RepID=UPI0021CB291B|nr:adenylate/guanylate cyclase domain-containing protein [Acidiferrimicrobium sp. IK]MCU4186813.1 adenylate/guanylate cyclase domain-containing protein [Acidiferrimicrobium sp. IK]
MVVLGRVLERAGRLGDVTDGTRGRRVQVVLTGSLLAANAVGALVVAGLALFVIPGPTVFSGPAAPVTFGILPLYVILALLGGAIVGTRAAVRSLEWVREGRPPTFPEASAMFAVPARLVLVQAGLWAGAAALFSGLYGSIDSRNLPRVAFPVAFGGLIVCANALLLTEMALRPVAAEALAVRAPDRRAGVRGRTLLNWALGSGLPVVGVITVALYALTRRDITVTRLAVTVVCLGAVTLVFGFLLMLLVSEATIAPIRAVREGMAAIGAGDFAAAVTVDDGTELGELQAGFNRMAAGLRERNRVRDLFGRHVGAAVAAAALETVPELGGEERYVAVLFIDVVGSTQMADARPPSEVVGLLNRFFAVIVDEVEARSGIINKFIGDAAMAVFGAPVPAADPASAALAAARAVVARLQREVPDVAVGAAVSAGIAVAGNIGAQERFEYTVIGDPVNEAARLSELAKTTGGLVASGRAVADADPDERGRWRHVSDVVLRGRSQETGVYQPGRAVEADA